MQIIVVICSECHSDLYTRVCKRNRKWPELQARDAAGTWGPIPNTIFDPAKAEYSRKAKEEAEKKKAKKLREKEARQMPMDTLTLSQSRDPRQPS